jgi:hypothetical protein
MLELGIGGNDLLAYALVWGFCQDGTTTFRGSLDYLATWLGSTRRTAANVLTRLQDLGLIEKRIIEERGVKFTEFVPVGKNFTSSENFSSKVENFSKKQEKISPNNNRDNNRDKYNNPLISSPFDFYKALINAGVTPETAEAWLVVRKAKRSVNSELAFRETMKEVRKSGRSAEECIRFSAARSWAGFMAQWLEREENGTGTARARKPKDGDAMMRMYEKLTRSSQPDPNDLPDLPDEQ